jgi:hypothetical protein
MAVQVLQREVDAMRRGVNRYDVRIGTDEFVAEFRNAPCRDKEY